MELERWSADLHRTVTCTGFRKVNDLNTLLQMDIHCPDMERAIGGCATQGRKTRFA